MRKAQPRGKRNGAACPFAEAAVKLLARKRLRVLCGKADPRPA